MERFELSTPALRKRSSAVELHRLKSFSHLRLLDQSLADSTNFDTSVDTSYSLVKWPERRYRPGRGHSDTQVKEQSPCPHVILPRPPSRASPTPTSRSSRMP